MSEFCTICYVNQPLSKLNELESIFECDCMFSQCTDCIQEWVITNLKNQYLNEKVVIRCPSLECKKPYLLEDFVKLYSLIDE